MKYFLFIGFFVLLNSCGSNPKVTKKNTVFDNTLDRETVVKLASDYLQQRGLISDYPDQAEEIIEHDEYWAVSFRKKILGSDAESVTNNSANTTRLVLKIDKQTKEISEEYIK